MSESKEYEWMVSVRCITFNHAPYITDAMNGFCMQETNFPYVCVIVDDCSTDGEQDVIKHYLAEHFEPAEQNIVKEFDTEDYSFTFARHKKNQNCYFAVYYLKYNHYSVKKPKTRYLNDFPVHSKYIALCEGDDYWIHPRKLQMQVDYMSQNSEVTMTCNRTKLFSVAKNKVIGENYCYKQSQTVDPKDVIRRTGLFISTCSILYRSDINNNRPDYWRKCKVGDYPLQIMCAMKGRVFFFNDIMSVYRVENSDSWMGTQKWVTFSKSRLEVIRSRIHMYEGFANDFPKYEKVFRDKICDEINRNIPDRHSPKSDVRQYLDAFAEDIKDFPFKWKLDRLIRKIRFPRVRLYYTRIFMEKYLQKKIMY